ncbi:putative mannose-6-phosphate isomerase GmuF [Planctomycetes bacterium Pan216]|uniref:Putative mannose-6-phosphate isomerase GmuF n=1 Tax=Kolteria novifilia TaxID=2527975 RepID=A0A518BA32_9BACT|nr:putative mannose-6-phosphate isomerase GmuF [Planctomycetes bacterium Pan216]
MALPPLVLDPYLRPQIWGGRRLESVLGKTLPDDGSYGESWEVSAHRHSVSRVADGPFEGMLLTDLCAERAAELYGTNRPENDEFPLLIKFLDAQKLLSVQVHPDDETAARLLGNERGKTESWVVLDVQPEGRIYAGLKEGVTRDDLQRHLEAGTTDECLYSFQPKVGDCLLLEAGTVHTVGGGVMIAEVQQSSDATFRLFDWNRLGTDGVPRQLHIEESLESIDWNRGPLHPLEPTEIAGFPDGVQGQGLSRSPFFAMDRYRFSAPLRNPYENKLSIWMILDGFVELESPTERRGFPKGTTVLLPASASEATWHPNSGEVTILGVTLSP